MMVGMLACQLQTSEATEPRHYWLFRFLARRDEITTEARSTRSQFPIFLSVTSVPLW